LCQAAYEVAKECKTGFADTASAFHKAGSPEEAMKRQYWAWDKVHLGPAGHDLVADTVFAAIGSKGLADLGAAPNASWMKASAPAQLAEGETPLSSFEPGQDDLVRSAGGKIVAEHATDGKHALRLVSLPADYAAMSIEDGRALRLVRENSRVLVDVFNPQDGDVFLGVSVRDPESKDFNSRYNGSVTVKPGKSTIDFDYTRLARSGTAKNATPDFVRTGQIMLIVFFLDPRGSGRPVTLFFDNVRLASAPAGKAS
jgi:hypothetical protein